MQDRAESSQVHQRQDRRDAGLSVDVVNDNLRRNHQPHKRWVDALLASALAYREIGETIHGVRSSIQKRDTPQRHRVLSPPCDEYSRSLHHLRRGRSTHSQTAIADPRAKKSEHSPESPTPTTQRLTWNVRSPIDFDSFTISIHEREKDTEQLNVRMVEAWRHQFDRLIPRQPGDHDDPRKKVIGAATALIERLGRPPLDENYDNPGESAMFA